MPLAATTDQTNNPFIRELASSYRSTRENALNSLRTFLRRSAPFEDLEFLKLWRGLFFCMWMTDKPLTQQRLARDFADLLDVVNGSRNFLGFVGAFWKTIAREWGGIDALRMDKFLYLVRCYVRKGFEVVRGKEWQDGELLEGYLDVLREVPFNAPDSKIPNGLRFHVIEIYTDELDKVDTARNAPIGKILAPLKELAEKSPTRAVRVRASEALQDDILQNWYGGEQEGGVPDNDTSSHSEKDDGEDGEFRGFED